MRQLISISLLKPLGHASVTLTSNIVVHSRLPFSSETQVPNTPAAAASLDWTTYWCGEGQRIKYPRSLTDNGHGMPKMRKTHTEWRMYFGHGARIGHLGATREVPDFEFSDGTPAPSTLSRYSFKHWNDKQLVTLIRCAALVEDLAKGGCLPRVPGVREQRDWDPEVPLFLDDSDEHGAAPPLSARGVARPVKRPPLSNGYFTSKMAEQRLGKLGQHDGRTLAAKGLIKDPVKEGDTLEPIAMFDSYHPSKMFNEMPLLGKDKTRPFWSRRRWNLSEQFIVERPPRAKNTIHDG
eukprot:Tbor_TRINITY_DN4488_c0_g1::TRINITY_DN4488_c0_g1_i1::g.8097::m.8097